MTKSFGVLVKLLVSVVEHANDVTALIVVSLAALGVAALSLLTLSAVVKALLERKK